MLNGKGNSGERSRGLRKLHQGSRQSEDIARQMLHRLMYPDYKTSALRKSTYLITDEPGIYLAKDNYVN